MSTGGGLPSRCQQLSSAPCGAALPHVGVPALLDPLTPAVCTTADRCAGQLAAWHRMCCREGSRPLGRVLYCEPGVQCVRAATTKEVQDAEHRYGHSLVGWCL